MEERIAMLEKQLEEQQIAFENYINGEIEKTKSITVLANSYSNFLNKYQIEHDAVLKKFEELDTNIEMIIKLREGDEKIRQLNEEIKKFK